MKHDAHGWWLAEAGPVEPRPRLEGERDADVVVIGGGFTGMWTAWLIRRLEPEASVVLLEGDVCASGPSGRNGGFANEMWFSLPALRRRFADADALAVARASNRAVAEIGEFCEAEGVDAWFRPGGYLQVATTEIHDGAWDETAEACRELGEPDACQPLTADQVAARCASPMIRGGAFYPGAATVHPARLAHGLRSRLGEVGIAVHERSHVRRLERGSAGVVAETDGGRVRAASAVLASGPSLAGFGPLRRRLTLTSSHMLITEPVPDVLDEVGWTGGECITDSRAMLHYFRTTPDGRIAFGWGGGRVVAGARLGPRVDVDGGLVRDVHLHLLRFFPALEGRRIEHAWGGPIDVSPSHLPVVGTLPGDRVHYAFGYTGNGVGPSRMVARSLASLALKRSDEPSRLALVDPPPVTVPPEPWRWIGGTIIRQALLRAETVQEAGLQPDPLTALVAGFPERIGIHIGR